MFGAFERMHERWRKRLRNRKGQSLIEFAMVFPFFLLALYGILYFGFLFADYVTLNDIARSTARTAAMSTESVETIKAKQIAKTGRMPSEALGDPIFLFIQDGKEIDEDGNDYVISYDKDETTGTRNVTVTIKARLNTNALLAKLFKTFYNFRWNDGSGVRDAGNSLPFEDGLTIQYTMYDEIQNRSKSS